MTVPPPERAGAAVRSVRRRWLRRLGRVGMWGGAAIFALVVALPALAFGWGAVAARIDVERGRARLYGFGRMDPNGPSLDDRSGLPWRSLGCSVDPISELWCGGYNSVARRAEQRGECVSSTQRSRTIASAEEAFERNWISLPVGASAELADSFVVTVQEHETVIGVRGRQRGRAWQFHPDVGELSAALEHSGEILYLRLVQDGGRWIDGVEHDWIRYLTFDVRTGECLQELRP